MEVYKSNLYENADPKPIKVKVYVARLRDEIAEYILWREIKGLVRSGLKEAHMSVVTHGKLYTTSLAVINQLSSYIKKDTLKLITITNDNEEHSKVIGGLAYRSLDLSLLERGFTSIASRTEKGKRVYYKPGDPLFVLDIKRNVATFRAIRGLMPKIYAGNVPGILYLFFVPDGAHFVEVHDWNAFVGEEIKIKQNYLRKLDKEGIKYSKVFRLESIKDDNAIVIDSILNNKLIVPLDNIYVPANVKLLHRFGVLGTLQAFTSFRLYSLGKDEVSEMTEYKFLEMALGEILPNKEKFTLRIGLTKITFHRLTFKLEE